MVKVGVYKNYGPTASGGWLDAFNWLRHRHLLFHLVGADLRARYRRSRLGILWALLWPILFASVFTWVAINIFHQPFTTYIVYVLTGVVMWDMLGGAFNQGASALVVGEGYLRQARIPYLLFPIRTVASMAVNFVFGSIAALGVTLVLTPQAFGWTWLWWPFVLLLTVLFCVPCATFSAIANLKFRDYQHGISIVILMLWYLSPALVMRDVYERPSIKWFTDLNPFASLLDIFRDPLMYHHAPSLHDVGLVAAYTVVMWAVALIWLKIESRNLIHYF
ncbi:hypothetical protein C5708_15035 [Caulobacter sp. CCUG 60055]|uniref:ABC transporter permease n=1 Tax=Caulobacter sp. CCUG 60055 TaxID=2100090 RepID=UPI001FA735D4|nr:ABC transporter permease [Caulobacter sp. CCUG 60055]MCI3181567.1 hypothetical protein [Caulobacter sp. CCUG 60055]